MPPSESQPQPQSQSHSHSRNSSGASNHQHAHAPATPSGLRRVHVPSERSSSPEETMHTVSSRDHEAQASSSSPANDLEFSTDGIQPMPDQASTHPNNENAPPLHQGGIIEVGLETDSRTRLLTHKNWDASSGCGREDCNHGTMSPRPWSHASHKSYYGTINTETFGGRYPGSVDPDTGEPADEAHALLGDAVVDGVLGGNGQKSTTSYLAERHGVKHKRMMYLAYYIPILNWAPQYKLRYLRGDFVAALTMASFYIPMSLSYASNLAHVPPVHGLYSFAINPLIYGILGSCPLMVVGPEAPGSLLTGEVVRENIKKGASGDNDGRRNAEIAGIVTCLAGAFILVAGIFRLGFLDNVLSRPFLRGFISAIGVVIFIDQLIPEMGLAKLAADQVSHGSTVDKIVFLIRNIGKANGTTCALSFSAFGIIMFFR
jgi:hypothetical protein